MEYFLKPESHLIEFFVIGDIISFSLENQKKLKNYTYFDKPFRINILSCKDLSVKQKDFGALLFRFKKQLLKVFI